MRGLKTTVFGIITVSVDVRIVNLFVFLAIYISWFISKFHRLHIRALCNFFGQEDRRPPKSECARTPMCLGTYYAYPWLYPSLFA